MTVFLISKIASASQTKVAVPLETVISNKISEELRYRVSEDDYFVSFDGSARELSMFIGAQGGALGGILISEVRSISGYGPSTLSPWFNEHAKNDKRNDK